MHVYIMLQHKFGMPGEISTKLGTEMTYLEKNWEWMTLFVKQFQSQARKNN